MNRTLRTPLAVALALTASATAACDCDAPEEVVGSFESCFSDGCGWEIDQAPGAALVSTWHPAEHGLSIPPHGAISRNVRVDAAEVQFVSSCAANMHVVITFAPPGQSIDDPDTALTTVRFIAQPSIDDAEDYTWNRMASFVTEEEGVPMDTVRVTIENRNDERCVVDEITLLGEPAC